jgi:hypothetical protein
MAWVVNESVSLIPKVTNLADDQIIGHIFLDVQENVSPPSPD